MVIIVFGLPGAGKSYFARYYSNKHDIAYFNTDIIRKKSNLEGNYSASSKQNVYDKMLQEAVEKVENDQDVILDATFYREDIRQRFKKELKLQGANLFFVEMRASEAVVKERLKKHREFSDADSKVFQQVKNQFDKLRQKHLELFSDRQSVEEMGKQLDHYISQPKNAA
jgi:predicted kinase